MTKVAILKLYERFCDKALELSMFNERDLALIISYICVSSDFQLITHVSMDLLDIVADTRLESW